MIKKASKFQKEVIEKIEKISESIEMIEGLCKSLEGKNPILINKFGNVKVTERRCFGADGLYPAVDNFLYPFIIAHRRYTIIYNELRDSLFELLNNGYQILPEKEALER